MSRVGNVKSSCISTWPSGFQCACAITEGPDGRWLSKRVWPVHSFHRIRIGILPSAICWERDRDVGESCELDRNQTKTAAGTARASRARVPQGRGISVRECNGKPILQQMWSLDSRPVFSQQVPRPLQSRVCCFQGKPVTSIRMRMPMEQHWHQGFPLALFRSRRTMQICVSVSLDCSCCIQPSWTLYTRVVTQGVIHPVAERCNGLVHVRWRRGPG